jgi:phosphohistidine phosphatase
MRHAQAQKEQYGQNDRERPISMAGMHELESFRSQIRNHFESLSSVLCSNAKRTRQTFEGVRPLLPSSCQVIFEDSLYQASEEVLWARLRSLPPHYEQIMVIGHNPCLTNVVRSVQKISTPFPTCGVYICATPLTLWDLVGPQNFRVEEYIFPEI